MPYLSNVAPRRSSTFYAGSITVFCVLLAGLLIQAAAQEPARNAQERSIISFGAETRSRVYWVLRSVLGIEKGERLGVSGAEVWTIPPSRMKQLGLQLRLVGGRLTRLPDDWTQLLKRVPDLAPSSVHDEMIKQVRASPEFVSIAMMRAQNAAVAEYALSIGADVPTTPNSSTPKRSSRIVIPVGEAGQVTIQRVDAVKTNRGWIWRGSVEESGESALLMWRKDGHLSGLFAYRGRIYTILSAGGDVYAVVESDLAKMPPDHSPATSDEAGTRENAKLADEAEQPQDKQPRGIAPFRDDERGALEAKQITIDLMMLYTKKAAAAYLQNPADMLELAVEQTNETLRNSGVGNVRLRLVHTQLIDYDEAGAQKFEHLYRMVDGIGPFKQVRRLRDEKHADIVGLMLHEPSGCGLSTRVGADAEEAYFVVHHSCAALTISIAHEVGHILGARHDRSIDSRNKPFPYGHGYVNGSKWRDIMNYHAACGGCPRSPYGSNPRVTYQGEPTGTITEDNARVILEQAERVAQFR
jgi:hypothetical protein